MKQPGKSDVGYIVIGVILIGVGILAIVSQFLGVSVWKYVWPGFVLLPGIMFFIGMFNGGKKAGGLAIPATILTILGLVLFYQNLFNAWWTWSFIWALIGPVAAGLGIIIFGLYSDKPEARRGGEIVLLVGLILLAVFGFSFGLGRLGAGGFVLPLVLIGVGIFLVIRRAGKSAPPPQTPSGDDVPRPGA